MKVDLQHFETLLGELFEDGEETGKRISYAKNGESIVEISVSIPEGGFIAVEFRKVPDAELRSDDTFQTARPLKLYVRDTRRVGYNELELDVSNMPEIALAGIVYGYTVF